MAFKCGNDYETADFCDGTPSMSEIIYVEVTFCIQSEANGINGTSSVTTESFIRGNVSFEH